MQNNTITAPWSKTNVLDELEERRGHNNCPNPIPKINNSSISNAEFFFCLFIDRLPS